MKSLFILFQYLVPQTLLSRLAGILANTSVRWIKNPFTRWFVQRYQVDMSEALEQDPQAYETFNDFFTRALKPDARPIDNAKHSIVCPADGCISQLGDIQYGRIFQAKGQDYSLTELLGGCSDRAAPFQNGHFVTIYLSPKDYHRVHMPYTGTLLEMIHVPGDLFSVNDTTADNVPRLFARNERVVCIFSTDRGPMAVVLVGAMIVASIETVWAGLVTPIKREVRVTQYGHENHIALEKGAELGRFKLGSTAIVVFPHGEASWLDTFTAGSPTRMGEALGARP